MLRSCLRSSLARRAMQIIPVPVRQDNYAYLLVDIATKTAAAVDPFDVPTVTEAADNLGVSIVAAITTHHHQDHSGGNKVFASTYPDAVIYAGSEKSPAATKIVKDKDEFTLGQNIRVKCLATPCHTQDSICFHVTDPSDPSHPGGVFTGDTLFIAGCGRFFEGTAPEMHSALTYLGTLPDETITYVGHEYTGSNVAFARSVEAKNAELDRLEDLVRGNAITTGLTTIGDEKKWNPFMRLASEEIRRSLGAEAETTDSALMDALRTAKNNFRG
ncbi:Lactamase-B domain-containing protein [Mycena indigotica]|uniref:hydroxyacylglutathione hydrolase n=1 Tax=Mycena indigotica TaxID=2126181 RepID=A0A8H6VYV4_9AGAR|nr:Lactamase-B domain-containing protein [Mycena indigotica]KAF7295308.1 Lactamase-B domain-containing protein [Mycena indigotica]